MMFHQRASYLVVLIEIEIDLMELIYQDSDLVAIVFYDSIF